MPLKTGRLTHPEKTFAAGYAATNDASYAGDKAGYGSKQAVWSAMQRPAVQHEIKRLQTEKLFAEGLPLAVNVHLAILADDRTPAGARVQAVKLMYDRTLGDADATQGKQAHEMSPDELAKAISEAKLRAAALEHVAADRAKPILDHDARPGIFD